MIAPKPLSMVSPLAAVVTGTRNAYEHCGIKLQLKEGKNGNPPTHRFTYPLDHATDEQISKEFEKRIEDGSKFFKSFYESRRASFLHHIAILSIAPKMT